MLRREAQDLGQALRAWVGVEAGHGERLPSRLSLQVLNSGNGSRACLRGLSAASLATSGCILLLLAPALHSRRRRYMVDRSRRSWKRLRWHWSRARWERRALRLPLPLSSGAGAGRGRRRGGRGGRGDKGGCAMPLPGSSRSSEAARLNVPRWPSPSGTLSLSQSCCRRCSKSSQTLSGRPCPCQTRRLRRAFLS